MTALFNAGLSVLVLRGNWRNKTNFFLGVYLFFLSLWALILIGTQTGNNYEQWLYCAKGAYAAGLIIAASFYLFSISFPYDSEIPLWRIALIYGLTVAYNVPLFLQSSFLTAGIDRHPWGNGAELSVFPYWIFVALFLYLYLGGLVRLWFKYVHAQGDTKMRLLIITLGVSITGVSGSYFDIFLDSPYTNNFQYIWTGPLFNTLMVVLILYAVFRFRLFNPKVIATEVIIVLLWIFTLLRTLLAVDSQDVFFNGLLFVLSFVIGYLLIQSVRAEVRAREEVEKLSQEKSEFMSFASHEIRNPITAMRGYASLISDGTAGEVPEQAKDVAQRILINGDTVLSLISEFLNKSKLELGQIAYQLADIDVGKTVTSIAEGFKSHARQKNLSLDVKIDYPHLVAHADEAKLREVIGNLVDNSIKYTEAGGVTIEVEKRNGMARITVTDTGVGITKETIPHLFQKFSRADAQKMNLLGTGLGLYLARTFIEGMGGKIRAESAGAGKGSKFIIELHTV